MSVRSTMQLTVKATEASAGLGAGADKTATLPHSIDIRREKASGTSSGQQDIVWSDRLSVSTTPTDVDLNALTSELDGSTLDMANITHVTVYNGGAANLLLGGATNSVAIFSDDSDIIVVPPGGTFVWDGGPDGLAVGGSDVLRLDAASGTLTVDVLLMGQSA